MPRKQQQINTVTEAVIAHIAMGVAMNSNPNTPPEALAQQRTHIAAGLALLTAQVSAVRDPNEQAAMLATAVADYFTVIKF